MSDTELVTSIGNPGPGSLYLPTLGVILGAGDGVEVAADGSHSVTRASDVVPYFDVFPPDVETGDAEDAAAADVAEVDAAPQPVKFTKSAKASEPEPAVVETPAPAPAAADSQE